MTSLSKTTGARNGLWAEKGGPFCLLTVFLHGSACSTLLLSVRSMPKTNCCVPYCHASSTRHTRLSWHRLPKDKEIKRQWAALIRNDTLRVDSNGTSDMDSNHNQQLLAMPMWGNDKCIIQTVLHKLQDIDNTKYSKIVVLV